MGGLILKNRIIFAPTTLGLNKTQQLAFLRRVAQGGCAMIIIGDVPVWPHSFGPSLYTKKGFVYYKNLTEEVHRAGCKICAQLHQSDSDWKAMVKYLPALIKKRMTAQQLRDALNRQAGPYITSLCTEKVQAITNAFGSAAQLAQKAGFDMVQVHGDRMCGSFSSAILNHRTDCYGGSAENRARFAVQAVSAVTNRRLGFPLILSWQCAQKIRTMAMREFCNRN